MSIAIDSNARDEIKQTLGDKSTPHYYGVMYNISNPVRHTIYVSLCFSNIVNNYLFLKQYPICINHVHVRNLWVLYWSIIISGCRELIYVPDQHYLIFFVFFVGAILSALIKHDPYFKMWPTKAIEPIWNASELPRKVFCLVQDFQQDSKTKYVLRKFRRTTTRRKESLFTKICWVPTIIKVNILITL